MTDHRFISDGRLRDPFHTNTYAGFAAAGPASRDRQSAQDRVRHAAQSTPQRRSGRLLRALVGAGALAATFALGAVFGPALQQDLAARFAPPSPSRPDQLPSGPRANAGPAPPSIEVAPAPVALAIPAPPPAEAPAVASPAMAEPAAAIVAQPPPRAASAPQGASGLKDSCASSSPRSRSPACQGAFPALERKVNAAYAAAIRAGAAAGPLSHEQENWIIRRDRVRRDHPELLPDLYRARIAELEAHAAKTAEAVAVATPPHEQD